MKETDLGEGVALSEDNADGHWRAPGTRGVASCLADSLLCDKVAAMGSLGWLRPALLRAVIASGPPQGHGTCRVLCGASGHAVLWLCRREREIDQMKMARRTEKALSHYPLVPSGVGNGSMIKLRISFFDGSTFNEISSKHPLLSRR